MLQIKEIHDYTKYKSELDKYFLNESLTMIFEADDGEEVIGYGIAGISPEKIIFKDISCADRQIYMGIARAMLNSADLRGIKSAEFDLKDLSIIKSPCMLDGDIFLPDIGTFFEKKCCNNSCSSCKNSL